MIDACNYGYFNLFNASSVGHHWLEMEPEVEAGVSSQENLHVWLGNLIFGLFGSH